MLERFPLQTRRDIEYDGQVLGRDGQMRTVKTLVPHPRIHYRDILRYMRGQLPSEICRDVSHLGMSFFVADAKRLLDRMSDRAEQGITIYFPWLRKTKRRDGHLFIRVALQGKIQSVALRSTGKGCSSLCLSALSAGVLQCQPVDVGGQTSSGC